MSADQTDSSVIVLTQSDAESAGFTSRGGSYNIIEQFGKVT
jgi:hypothetical protein